MAQKNHDMESLQPQGKGYDVLRVSAAKGLGDGMQGKFGPGIAVQRVDWLKTHSSSGPSLLYHATPGNGQPDLYHSTLNQLVQGLLPPKPFRHDCIGSEVWH